MLLYFKSASVAVPEAKAHCRTCGHVLGPADLSFCSLYLSVCLTPHVFLDVGTRFDGRGKGNL